MLDHAAHQSNLSQWAAGRLHSRWGDDPDGYDPAHVDAVHARAQRFFGEGKYFGLSLRGLELIPDTRPMMLVSNHSGGTTIPDVWGFAVAWYLRFGSQRPLHILAHELLFAVPRVARWLERCGILRASHENARAVLTRGRDLLVYPGGDQETWRPYAQRYQVDFAGRTGYAKLALQKQVPITPIAHAGAHETLRVLTSGRWLAKAMGLHRFCRAEVWPIHLSLPWGIGFGPLPHLPLPTTLRYVVGEPILPAGDVGTLDARVRGAVQQQLSQLQSEAERPKSH